MPKYLSLAASAVVEVAKSPAAYPNDKDWIYVQVRIGGRRSWAPTEYLRVLNRDRRNVEKVAEHI